MPCQPAPRKPRANVRSAEALLRKALMRATYVLWVLWGLLFMIGWLGVTKPGIE